jgi:hypothetical protein
LAKNGLPEPVLLLGEHRWEPRGHRLIPMAMMRRASDVVVNAPPTNGWMRPVARSPFSGIRAS